jgi:ecdysteroid 2-hydroxylase
MYTSGRSASNFPEPNRFLPERWQRNETTGGLMGVSNPSATIPFALGARSCIGRKLAETQMNQLISKVGLSKNMVFKKY